MRAAAASLTELSSASTQQGDLVVHFITVGQGDATLLELPNGTAILVDSGSLSKDDRDPDALKDYLEDTLPDDRIETLVITHPDSDHYNLLPYVVSDIQVDQVLIVGRSNEHGAPANVAQADHRTKDGFQDWLDNPPAGTTVRVITAADIDAQDDPSNALFSSGDVSIWIVSAEVVHDTNSRSIVLLVSFGDFDLMLTGDAERQVEDAIIARYDDWWLDVECLKLGHHGSRNATFDSWVTATSPEMAIASATIEVKHGHPNTDVRSRIEGSTIAAQSHRVLWWDDRTTPDDEPDYREAVYSTATNGTIVITTNGSTFSVNYSNN